MKLVLVTFIIWLTVTTVLAVLSFQQGIQNRHPYAETGNTGACIGVELFDAKIGEATAVFHVPKLGAGGAEIYESPVAGNIILVYPESCAK